MLFRINDKKEEVLDYCIDKKNLYMGIILFDELEKVYKLFSIEDSAIEKCKNIGELNYNTVFLNNNYLFGVISLINSRNIFLKKDQFAFYIFKNIFLIIILDDDDSHILSVFNNMYTHLDESNITIAKIIYLFFNGLIINDYQYIERLQDDIEDLEKFNSREQSVTFVNKLKLINKELLLLRNYYESLVGVGEELQIDYHHFFNKEDIIYMQIFVQRVTRLSDNIALLQELSSQSRESHQSQLDYSMNKTMEFFTVVTSIFMPLTLLTGWYGMNFKYMPEINYKYSYYILITISIVIIGVCIYWFKKKKYF